MPLPEGKKKKMGCLHLHLDFSYIYNPKKTEGTEHAGRGETEQVETEHKKGADVRKV